MKTNWKTGTEWGAFGGIINLCTEGSRDTLKTQNDRYNLVVSKMKDSKLLKVVTEGYRQRLMLEDGTTYLAMSKGDIWKKQADVINTYGK